MNSRKILSYMLFAMVGITLLGEAPSAYAKRHRRHRRHASHHTRHKSCEDNSVTAAQQLQKAGIQVDNKTYNSCANANITGKGALRDHQKFFGVLLKTFARSACRPSNDPTKIAMAYGTGADPLGDNSFPMVLAQMQRGYDVASMGAVPSPSSKVTKNLVSTYSLLIGLAARESDFNMCEGADASVHHQRHAYEIEAGAFQTSYDVHAYIGNHADSANQALMKLESSYTNASAKDCMGGSGGTPDASSGAVAFQAALKSCPALAVEDAAITLRHAGLQHYGPIIRGQAQAAARDAAACKPLFENIAEQLSDDPGLCDTLQVGSSKTPARRPKLEYAEVSGTTATN